MNLLTQILFAWIFAALSAGTPPAGFDAQGRYIGTSSAKPALVEQYARR